MQDKQINDLSKLQNLEGDELFIIHKMGGGYSVLLSAIKEYLSGEFPKVSFWEGTQEEYDVLTNKDNNTLYCIPE